MATFVTSLCFAILVCSAATVALDRGFTVELIPRNSPKSPLYDPLETPSQRVKRLTGLSPNALHGARLSPNALRVPSLDIINIRGAYLINITMGTPPVQIVGIADTGSDLIWTQCHPCQQCFLQEAPLFKPSTSRTYTDILYGSRQCMIYEDTSRSPQGSTCQYETSYGDGSFTIGNLASESIGLGSTLGETIKFPNFVFGCGYNNGGRFNSHTSGIIGLGGGDASLVSQLGSRSGGKFSYCLVPYLSETKFTSKLKFGSYANVVGRGVVSTPMVQKSPRTFYYMTLEGITVNGMKFEVLGSSGRGADEGNIIIDSGTTLTMLPPYLYSQIINAVFAAIHLPNIEDPFKTLSLCYEFPGLINNFPKITVHFTGADVVLNWYNAFVNVTPTVTCFSFIPSTSDLSIYGNLAHMNFLVGFDLTRRTVSFMPADCTAY